MKRKRQDIRKQGFFITIFKYFVVVVLMVFLGSTFVWKNVRMYEVGVSINKKKLKLERLREGNKMVLVRISALVSPQNIKKNLKRHDLKMILPDDANIIYLPQS